jgi:glycosyltransferase involved in cell wall biosynthesis
MAQRIRVLHILSDLMPYGHRKMVASLTGIADRRRFQMAVVSLHGRSDRSLAAQLEAAGIPVIHLDKSSGLDLRMFRRLRKTYADFEPHIVHTHQDVLRYTWPVSSWMRPAAQVHTLHNADGQEADRLGMWLQIRALRGGAVTPVVTAQDAAASLQRIFGLRSPIAIPCGIPIRNFAPQPGLREEWRGKAGFGPNDLLIASPARSIPQSGGKTLIDAFARVAATGAQLLLPGDSELEGNIRPHVESLGLSQQVHFLAGWEDSAEILAAVDAVTLHEENPVAAMEAMAAGKACAMVAKSATAELIEDNRSGILVKPGDVRGLGEALARLVDSPHLRARLGYAARERAVQRFDHRWMVNSYEALYTRLLGGSTALAA